jgi:hypothetical protein
MKMNIFFCLGSLFLLNCSKGAGGGPSTGETAKAHVYYVATTGDDGNMGTKDQPFRSAGKALGLVVPGDTVMMRGGTYYEQLSFSHGGIRDQYVTVKAYPGERPVLDGSKIVVSGATAMVSVSNMRYVALDGLDICNVTTANGTAEPEGIYINGGSHDIAIRNCNIYHIWNTSPISSGRSAHAILVLGTNNTTPVSNLVIEYCTVHDTKTGTSENITLAGNVDGFSIRHNKVYDTENIGIIIAGGDNLNPSGDVAVNYARNGVVSDNELTNVSMANSVDAWGADNYGAIAIYICGGAGTLVENNKVWKCDRGIGLVSESKIYATTTTVVRNNVVDSCWRTGIYMGDYLNFIGVGTKNCSIVSNTLHQNNRALGAFGEIEGEIRLTEHCDNDTIANNIIYAGDVDVLVHKYTGTGSANIFTNNTYYTKGTPQWIWGNTSGPVITDLAGWRTACAGDAGAVVKSY